MYFHKIIHGMTPNCGLSWTITPKYGHLFKLNDYAKYEHSNRKQFFQFMGPRLFNVVPVKLRPYIYNMNFDHLKMALNKFLSDITYHQLPDLTNLACVKTWSPNRLIPFYIGSPFLGSQEDAETLKSILYSITLILLGAKL